MLHCDRVGHRYRRQPQLAVDDVTIRLDPGVTGFVGVNGAGKTTLMRILAGAMKPTSGSVALDDDDLYGPGRRSALRRIALMPQEFRAPHNVRAVDAVEYIAWLRGLDGKSAARAATEALDSVGLADVGKKRMSRLSGGMRRRVALAQALATEPQMLLLDEPTTGLDPEQRVVLRNLIRGLPEDRITLISSHVMEDLESVCGRIIVIDAGTVLFHGPLSDFRSEHGGVDGAAEHAFLSLLTRHRTLV